MRGGKPSMKRAIPLSDGASIGDFQRYPGCRLIITCAACGWSRSYDPERVIGRLHTLNAGGYATRLGDVARRVQWNCPACRRMRWRAGLAWPDGLDPAEARRLANRYRN